MHGRTRSIRLYGGIRYDSNPAQYERNGRFGHLVRHSSDRTLVRGYHPLDYA